MNLVLLAGPHLPHKGVTVTVTCYKNEGCKAIVDGVAKLAMQDEQHLFLAWCQPLDSCGGVRWNSSDTVILHVQADLQMQGHM